MTSPFTVRLFRTLPSEQRTSMEVYAREVAGALRGVDGAPRVEAWHPRNLLPKPAGPFRRLVGYSDRYAAYQWQARGQDSDVNHVVDHGYGHLAFSLDPRRTVVTFHDAMLLKIEARELPVEVYPRFTILGHKLSLRAIQRVSRVIADSQSAKRDLLRFTDYPAEHVRVVPLGVSAHFRPPDARATPRRADGGGATILHVGHCGPYKNVEGILRSLPAINRRLGTPCRFTKAGAPFTTGQRALIGTLGIEGLVQHLGVVPLADLPRVYAQAGVLLMPSLYEGFGLPILEAMACGTPVVASNAGSLPEVVGNAGLLVDPLDTEAIAAAVARLLGDARVYEDYRRRGLEQARQFSWERTARETLAVYREVYEETH